MKRLLILVPAIAICTGISAQKSKNKDSQVPAFGKVDKADLEMKECDFDKKAEALVLFDQGELSCIIGGGTVDLELVRHVRIKILADKGRDHADIKLVYHSFGNDEDIRDLVAQTYNLDANGEIVTAKVDKKSIYDKKLNKRFTQKIFTFPEVKAGSIIEYKYKHTGAGIINWYFQRSIPVAYSEFKLDFPNEIELLSQPVCSREYEKSKNQTATRTVQRFAMRNVPALRDEPFILNEDDYLERIETRPIAINVDGRRISMTSTWPRIVKLLMEDEDFGIQLKRDIPRTSDLDALLSKTNGPYEKMKVILKYVRDNMEWNGYTSIWALDGVKSAWKDKKGTAGEINLILVNLLRDAGLTAKPILVSTHSNGMINTMNPTTAQFDKVLAWVEIDNAFYVLDATDKETPPHLIPFEVVVTEGLVIEKFETFDWGWKFLWDDRKQSKNIILMHGVVDGNGRMNGEVGITSYDYARLNRISTARKGVKEMTEKFFTSANPGINVDSIKLENQDSDSLPLVQKVYYNQQLSGSGDYLYFSTNMFTGLEKNPFVADNRFSDVFFGVNQHHAIIGNFYIPEDYEFEELPKNLKMIMPDTSIAITRVAQVNQNHLAVRVILEFKKPFFSNQEYAEFREFYKKLQDIMNEQFVIRKKAKAKP